MHIVVHLLVQNSAQNKLINGEIEEELCAALEGAPKIYFTLQFMYFTLQLIVYLTVQPYSLHLPYFLYSANQTELLTFSS